MNNGEQDLLAPAPLPSMRDLDKPLEPVGMNQLLMLPPASEMRAAISSITPKPIKKAVDFVSELVPMSAGEAALMVGGGKAILAGGKKLLGKLPEVAARRLAPEADMLLDVAKDYLKQGATVATETGKKIAAGIAALGAANAAEKAAAAEVTTKIISGKAGNINLDYIGSNNVRRVIKEAEPLIREQVSKQTREGYTDELMKSLANAADVSVDALKKMVPGDILNAEYTLAARNILHESASRTFGLAQSYKNATEPLAKARALQAFKEAALKHNDIQIGVSGITAEAGRLLRQFRTTTTGSDSAKEAILKTVMEEGSTLNDDAVEMLANKIGAFTEGDVTNFVSKSMKATMADKAVEFITAMKLTNPMTYLKNTFGNTMAMLTRLGEKGTAPAIDFLRTAGGQAKPRSVYFGELPAEIYGMTTGMKKGAQSAAKELLKIVTGDEAASARLGEVNVSRQAIGGVPGQIVRIPFNILSATDEFFRNMLNEGALHSHAYRQAANEGKAGMALVHRVQELVEKPSKELAAKAFNVSKEFTFQNELGKIAKGFNLARQHPLIKVIMPFFKTPVNIGKFIAQRTPPFSLMSPRNWEDIVVRGGPEASEAIARMANGAVVSSAMVIHALEGKVTGAPPKDPTERDALERTGWRAYSLKVGDTYHSYLGLDPLATQMAVASDIATTYMKRGIETPTEMAEKLASSIIKNISNQPYLQGLSGVLDALSDPEKSGGKFITGTIAGLIPTGIAATGRAQDRTIRKPDGLVDTLKSRLPGLSKEVPPKRNVFGESYKREEDPMVPFAQSAVKNDPVNKFVSDNGYSLGFPSKTVHGRRLDPYEYDTILKQSGREIKLRFDARRQSKEFLALPLAERHKRLNQDVEIARTKANAQFVVPAELRALRIDVPVTEVQKEILKRVLQSPTYKSSKNDVAKRDLVLSILAQPAIKDKPTR